MVLVLHLIYCTQKSHQLDPASQLVDNFCTVGIAVVCILSFYVRARVCVCVCV